MAPDSFLRPGEEDWKGAFDNLCQRFSKLGPEVVADTLRQNEGHAGRTAQALRKLPEPKSSEGPTSTAPGPTKEVQKVASASSKSTEVTKTNAEEKVPSKPAAAKEKVELVKACPTPAKAEVTPASTPPADSKLIFVAALQGDVQLLNNIIASGADLNSRYTGKPNKEHADKIIDATPLHLVVTMGKANIVEVLLKHGADIEAKMRRGLGPGKPPEEQYSEMTPLHLAAMEGHARIVEMLLKRGADKTAKMKLKERKGDKTAERVLTPLETAHEVASKGHSRQSVISLLST